MNTKTDNTASGLTFGQTAQRLGIGVNTRRWVRAEQCPVVRDGHQIRIPATWVAAELDRPTPQQGLSL